MLLFQTLAAQNTEEAKVKPYTLPEILKTEEGTKISSIKTWENARRQEILKLFEDHVYGQVPKDFDGNTQELVFKLAHSKPETTVFWYIDETFIGSTKAIHDMAVVPTIGKHIITVVDEFGNEAKRIIEVSN